MHNAVREVIEDEASRSSRDGTVPSRDDPAGTTCAAPDCSELVVRAPAGRARFCCDACRQRSWRKARRARDRGPVSVEVDVGSASSRGRPPSRSFLIRLRRGKESVVVTIGLTKVAAEMLASHIADLLE